MENGLKWWGALYSGTKPRDPGGLHIWGGFSFGGVFIWVVVICWVVWVVWLFGFYLGVYLGFSLIDRLGCL